MLCPQLSLGHCQGSVLAGRPLAWPAWFEPTVAHFDEALRSCLQLLCLRWVFKCWQHTVVMCVAAAVVAAVDVADAAAAIGAAALVRAIAFVLALALAIAFAPFLGLALAVDLGLALDLALDLALARA
jgi:hypothetical protein